MILVRDERFATIDAVAARYGVTAEFVRDYITRNGHAHGIGLRSRYDRATVDRAEAWIIRNRAATYADAAKRFDISAHAIRARMIELSSETTEV